MRRVILPLAMLAALGCGAAAAVLAFGAFDVSARSGHWRVVSWTLHQVYRASVRARAPSAEAVPDLDDPALADLGLRHYQSACAACHGSPDQPAPRTIAAMEPEPPPIEAAIEGWEPRHLHWIIENGVKMTGMPAWPATGRGDEVWAVVAYLETVRRGEGTLPPDPPTCASCHREISRHVPRLDILGADEVRRALAEYRSGARPSGIMAHAASLIPDGALDRVAQDASQIAPPARSLAEGPPAGAELARRGTRLVPACTACHGPDRSVDGRFPPIAGQDANYLEAQLRLWRSGVRDGSDLMTRAAENLTDEQIRLLSQWFASLPPQAPRAVPPD